MLCTKGRNPQLSKSGRLAPCQGSHEIGLDAQCRIRNYGNRNSKITACRLLPPKRKVCVFTSITLYNHIVLFTQNVVCWIVYRSKALVSPSEALEAPRTVCLSLIDNACTGLSNLSDLMPVGKLTASPISVVEVPNKQHVDQSKADDVATVGFVMVSSFFLHQ